MWPSFCSNSATTLKLPQALRHCRAAFRSRDPATPVPTSCIALSQLNRDFLTLSALLSCCLASRVIGSCMKQKSGTKAQRSERPPGPYVLDRLIVPRITGFAQNNDYTDIDAVADYLRGTYREYQRHKLGPFRSQVAKAVQQIQQKGGIDKTELHLQVCVLLCFHSVYLLICANNCPKHLLLKS